MRASTPGKDRTCDQLLRRQLLYPLSYGGKEERAGDENRTRVTCLEGRSFTIKLLPQSQHNITFFGGFVKEKMKSSLVFTDKHLEDEGTHEAILLCC